MKTPILIAAVALTTLFACSKKEEVKDLSQPAPTQNIEHMPLSVGNYWVYDNYIVDSLGNETFSHTDSAYINKDTIINSNTYYVVDGGGYAKTAIGTIIRNENNSVYEYSPYDDSKTIRFTTNNIGSVFKSFTDSLINTSYSFWVNAQSVSVFVGANAFVCYDMQTQANNYNAGAPFPLRNFHRHYNKNIGVATNQFAFTVSPIVFESRLVRYNIK